MRYETTDARAGRSQSSSSPWSSELQFRRLLDGLSAGAYTCDPEGLITYYNRRAVQLWGRAPKLNDPEDRFCGSFRLFSRDGSPIPHDRCWMALALQAEPDSEEYDGREIVIERPNGSRITVLAHANAIRDEWGTLLGAVNVLVDITERERMEKALRRSEEELNDFFENAAVGLHWVGPDGRILRANRAELELLGYSEEEYVGHHVAEFHVDLPVVEEALERLARGETLPEYEARLRCRDGSIKHVVVNSNVRWDDGRFVHTRCFVRDITDRKRAEDALREANRRKDEFLAVLSHELRSPLAPICSVLETLRRSGPRGRIEERLLAMLDRQVKHLVRLVDDLLEVSRITRGKPRLRRERVQLAAVLERALEIGRPFVDDAGLQLAVALPSEALYLDADPARLAQVVANLLSNAAKFTEREGRVWLEAERDGSEVVIRVRDTGVGISAERLPQIFDPFTPPTRSADGGEEGLGIGLTVVKGFVEMHGGRVHAHSDGPGRGAEFEIRLPVPPDAALSTAGPSGAVEWDAASLPKRRVLVVDDNRDAAETLGLALELMGCEVRVAHSGAAALSAVAEFRPAAVLLDIGMPGMDGYEVARRVRARSDEVMLIALTGWGQAEDRRRCREVGFDHHLTKPVDFSALQILLKGEGRGPAGGSPARPEGDVRIEVDRPAARG